MKAKLYQLLDLLAPYSKTLVVPLAGAILGLLNSVGILPDMTVREAVSVALGLVAALVFSIPNRKQ